MKFNLKNRPSRGNRDADEWFEGFEKELRERLDQTIEDKKHLWKTDIGQYLATGVRDTIKEILGE